MENDIRNPWFYDNRKIQSCPINNLALKLAHENAPWVLNPSLTIKKFTEHANTHHFINFIQLQNKKIYATPI
jgi:hypothetical protein